MSEEKKQAIHYQNSIEARKLLNPNIGAVEKSALPKGLLRRYNDAEKKWKAIMEESGLEDLQTDLEKVRVSAEPEVSEEPKPCFDQNKNKSKNSKADNRYQIYKKATSYEHYQQLYKTIPKEYLVANGEVLDLDNDRDKKLFYGFPDGPKKWRKS